MIRRLSLSVLATALPLLAGVASVVAPTATPAGAASGSPAYWLVASDGGVFAFGGAGFHGTTALTALHSPVVTMG